MLEDSTAYFISFLLIVAFTLMPVVVAVLLESFMLAKRVEKDQQLMTRHQRLDEEAAHKVHLSLDPMLATLLSASSSEELSDMIRTTFGRLDSDRSGALSYAELRDGLKKMAYHPPIKLTEDEWEAITFHRTLCTKDQEIDLQCWDAILRNQMLCYCQRKLAVSVPAVLGEDQHQGIMMFAIKLILETCMQQSTPRGQVSSHVWWASSRAPLDMARCDAIAHHGAEAAAARAPGEAGSAEQVCDGVAMTEVASAQAGYPTRGHQKDQDGSSYSGDVRQDPGHASPCEVLTESRDAVDGGGRMADGGGGESVIRLVSEAIQASETRILEAIGRLEARTGALEQQISAPQHASQTQIRDMHDRLDEINQSMRANHDDLNKSMLANDEKLHQLHQLLAVTLARPARAHTRGAGSTRASSRATPSPQRLKSSQTSFSEFAGLLHTDAFWPSISTSQNARDTHRRHSRRESSQSRSPRGTRRRPSSASPRRSWSMPSVEQYGYFNILGPESLQPEAASVAALNSLTIKSGVRPYHQHQDLAHVPVALAASTADIVAVRRASAPSGLQELGAQRQADKFPRRVSTTDSNGHTPLRAHGTPVKTAEAGLPTPSSEEGQGLGAMHVKGGGSSLRLASVRAAVRASKAVSLVPSVSPRPRSGSGRSSSYAYNDVKTL